MEEKEDGVVFDVGSLEKKARLETPERRRKRDRDEEGEDPGFTIPCTILAFMICIALLAGLCIFALYKVTSPHLESGSL